MSVTKLLTMAALFAMSAINVQAQKFYGLIFCNTIDAKIGATCAIDESRMISEMGSIAESMGYEWVERVHHGSDCSKEALMSELNNLNPGNRDVVLFYYSGHGVHSNAWSDDKFPQMCLKYSDARDQSKFVPVRVVQENLRNKKQHLAIILSDCCNNIDESGIVTPKGMSRGIQLIKRSTEDNYRHLFVESDGMVVATGCKLGQTSGCIEEIGGEKIGGIFTYVFCDQLAELCENSGKATWGKLLSNVKNSVASVTRNEQEPYYLNTISQEGGGSSGGGSITPTPVPPSGNFSTFQEALENLLRTSDITTRRNLIPRIKQRCFGGKTATIITVGRNLTTIVDYEDLDAYLTRLADNKKIIRIAVLKDQTDGQGKRFITVTETRTE